MGNRIASIITLVPSKAWRHVPTQENPADCASRGLSPRELRDHHLWWTGPPWLAADPILVPKQPKASELVSLQSTEEKSTVNLTFSPPAVWLEQKFSSFITLTHVMAWVRRFSLLFLSAIRHSDPITSKFLTTAEIITAEEFLIKASQQRSFSIELKSMCAIPPKPLSSNSKLLCLHPYLSPEGILLVGRLSKAPISFSKKFPVIISSNDHFTQLLFNYEHVRLGHCGPTLLISHVGNNYHVLGARRLARSTCSRCVICRKAAAQPSHQLMGQLPAARTTPTRPFNTTGVDYAGPFLLKMGRVRRPVVVKAYLAIFVCFYTKEVHIEVVNDLTTEAFLASLRRFTSRRGLPATIYSDHGSNFAGANNDLKALYKLLESSDTISSIQSFLLSNKVTWQHIPERAPHFGGLWEAAVKSTKFHLKRVIGQRKLTESEFNTVVIQVEACLNSGPLGPLTGHSPDGSSPLTPSHLINGGSMQAYPETPLLKETSYYRRWVLCQAMVQHFWRRWSGEYLQHLQRFQK